MMSKALSQLLGVTHSGNVLAYAVMNVPSMITAWAARKDRRIEVFAAHSWLEAAILEITLDGRQLSSKRLMRIGPIAFALRGPELDKSHVPSA
jgi:hypothetical protein